MLVSIDQSLSIGQANSPVGLDSDTDGESPQGTRDNDIKVDGWPNDAEDFPLRALPVLPNGIKCLLSAGTWDKPSPQKIRSDRRATKKVGLKVGIFGDVTTGSLVCAPVRVVKLRISEEAMQA